MITFSLQSGSNGNAIYVEAAGTRLLFDAGVSGRVAERRLAERARDIREVHALVLSHDHADHTRCAGVWQRKFGLPIHATPGTWRAAAPAQGRVDDLRPFHPGATLEFGRVAVHTLPTPHDGADGVAFVVEAEGFRLGIFTDLGHPFPLLQRWLERVDAAYLESNYDPELLANGPYPPALQARIRGAGGHLSNDEAAALLRACHHKPRWIALAHLSEKNNRPDLALRTHRAAAGRDYPFHLAGRDGPSDLLELPART
ncbi:MAG: MBL fold metallo-hydrolase [Acidobacteria bacterium]|nr:MBL fold metallo-hydrolase [Acidobacteriota bacterium]